MDQKRRETLKAGAGLLALLAAAGIIVPGEAHAADWNKAAFEGKTTQDALKALGASGPTNSADIVIRAADIAENGAVVPVGVATTLPGVKRLLLLVEKNPAVLSAMFDVSDAVEANFGTRVKMGQSSNVYAVALMADGRVLYTAKEVKVTLGGCGG